MKLLYDIPHLLTAEQNLVAVYEKNIEKKRLTGTSTKTDNREKMYLIIYQNIGAGFTIGDDIAVSLLGREGDRLKISIEMPRGTQVTKKRGDYLGKLPNKIGENKDNEQNTE